MDTTILIADLDAERRQRLHRRFIDWGFLSVAAANPLECLSRMISLSPEILVIDCDILWTNRDGVIARFVQRLYSDGRPLVLVMGDPPIECLSQRAGIPAANCFTVPVQYDVLQERIRTALTRSVPATTDRRREPVLNCR